MIWSPEFNDKDRHVLNLRGIYSANYDTLTSPEGVNTLVTKALYDKYQISDSLQTNVFTSQYLRSHAEEETHKTFDMYIMPFEHLRETATTWFETTYDADDFDNHVLLSAAIGMGVVINALAIKRGLDVFEKMDRLDHDMIATEMQKVIIPEAMKDNNKWLVRPLYPFPSYETQLNSFFQKLAKATTGAKRHLMAMQDGASAGYWFMQSIGEKVQ